jgi:hypothetical protein
MRPTLHLSIAHAAALCCAFCPALCPAALAEEGMWLPNAIPAVELKSKYGFEASPAALEHLQKSAVRFSTGGSGSIVSPNGLVMTNHHVGWRPQVFPLLQWRWRRHLQRSAGSRPRPGRDRAPRPRGPREAPSSLMRSA